MPGKLGGGRKQVCPAGLTRRARVVLAILLGGPFVAGVADPHSQLHLIYLHGRIVQEQQIPRPKHPRFGYYELDAILDAFRQRGFSVIGGIRPKSATESESADIVVGQVKRLMKSGTRAEQITIVGASMGAGIALLASVRLQNPDLRFTLLGACLSENVRQATADEGKGPKGHLLSIRESSDESTQGCPRWKADSSMGKGLDAREIVIDTGLSHGFLYRPLPDWVDPVVGWATEARTSQTTP
jgi:pimeloyl-ACP methyl ester carboxylesterase